MTAARWRQVEELFVAAAEYGSDRRKSFLAEACGSDEELRADVESLLASDARAEGFLEAPALELAGPEAFLACASTLAPGEQIGPYRVMGPLGTGGMGEVYHATDTRLDRSVAIKFLPREFAHDAQALRRFRLEARVASALNHPNICALHDLGEHGGQPFLVLEMIEGQTLKERFAGGPLPVSESLSICIKILEALEATHSRDIVHRDIKPANIVVTPRGEPKILDFGVAKVLPDRSQEGEDHAEAIAPGTSGAAPISIAGQTPGTVSYMSPEQLTGKHLDRRTDLFSLGVTLYEIVTGTLPFPGDDVATVRQAILTRQPPSPRKLNPSVSVELERIILKAIEKDRESRYGSAAAFRDDLRRLEASSRSSLWAWPVLALVAVVIAVTTMSLTKARNAPAPRVRKLTAFPGVEQFPAFSPDGRQIVFAWDGQTRDQFDLYRMDTAGGPPERLTNDRQNDCHPSWSPDGHSIALFHCSTGTSGGMRETRTDVWILDVQTGRKRKVTDVFSPPDPGMARLAWTADSKRLIVEDRESILEPFGLFLLELESGVKRRITRPPAKALEDRSPALSPDGRVLVFVRVLAYGIGDIHILDLDESWLPRSEPRRLTTAAAEITDVMWFGKRREILYAADQKGVRSLWRLPVRSRKAQAIPSLAPPGVDLALSPDGDRLAYTEGQTDDDIWRLNLLDKNDITGHPFVWSTRADQSPHISADGRIAFDSERSGNGEIWLVDRDGSVRQVTAMENDAGTPRLSPDGSEVVFDCRVNGNYDVYTVPASGGAPRRLTRDPASDAVPSWSRDGRWIYFSSNRNGSNQIWKMPATGGKPAQITREGGFGGFESTDGSLFYYAKTAGRPTKLWSVPARGGPETEVFSGLKSWANFSVTSDGIYFRPENPAPVGFYVQFFDFRTRQIRTIREVRTRPGSGFAVSPSGDWLLFAAKEFRGGDLVIVDNLR